VGIQNKVKLYFASYIRMLIVCGCQSSCQPDWYVVAFIMTRQPNKRVVSNTGS